MVLTPGGAARGGNGGAGGYGGHAWGSVTGGAVLVTAAKAVSAGPAGTWGRGRYSR